MLVLTNILQTTIIYSTPLILAALGGLFSERSGVVNIALEGLMTIGSFFAVLTTLYFGNPWLGLILAMVAGGLFAILHAFFTVTLKADQVVTGVALNFLALGFSLYLTKLLFAGAGQTPVVKTKLETLKLPFLSKIPLLGETFFNTLPTTYLAFLLVFLSYIFLYKTKFGLRLRAVGESPHAAETSGISVYKMRYFAVIVSGLFAGLGGASLSIAIGSEFNQNTVAGQGFIALAALIFGKWKPFGVFFAAIFFGFAVALSIIGQLMNFTKVLPSEVINMFPYFLTILALAGFVGKVEPPNAIGKTYEKGQF